MCLVCRHFREDTTVCSVMNFEYDFGTEFNVRLLWIPILLRTCHRKKREQLFRLAQRNDVLKWLIGSVLIALLGWISSTYFQNREANLQSARFTHERELQRLQFEHKSALERKDAERTYLSEYLTFALEDDIEKRLRFAHYFKSLVADSDMAPLWSAYYQELLDASGTLPDTGASAEIIAAARIGGLDQLGSERNISRILLGTVIDTSIENLRAAHLEIGYSDVGAHFLVRPNGDIQRGRPIEKTPAFAKRFNTGSIAIALACEGSTSTAS